MFIYIIFTQWKIQSAWHNTTQQQIQVCSQVMIKLFMTVLQELKLECWSSSLDHRLKDKLLPEHFLVLSSIHWKPLEQIAYALWVFPRQSLFHIFLSFLSHKLEVIQTHFCTQPCILGYRVREGTNPCTVHYTQYITIQKRCQHLWASFCNWETGTLSCSCNSPGDSE